MDRITEKYLQAVCDRINKATGSPMSPYTKEADGRFTANIGCYHLDHAYGGVNMVRMDNDMGGVTNVFGCGCIAKRALADRMHAFLAGIDAVKV